ncbi:hypothetical protein Ae201684_009603 [Aphanomyces euteiches]|uniref:Glucose-6-phosphate dehydrogenase (NADP(+)) n=1 Tax=Aphanomyces euteiches TaxID=100861 RepID=A0A6G0X0L9_9STRA|nr:hypothetical protein Ae201684_009603 [Aphanomyces euteiches]KAH9157848.1 hypothetical protein AeRB84_000320 [Aphanomyces euteiches]
MEVIFWRLAALLCTWASITTAHTQVLVVGGTGNLAFKYIWPAFEHISRKTDLQDLKLWAGSHGDQISGEKKILNHPVASLLNVRYAQLRSEEDYKSLAARSEWEADAITGLVVYLAVPPAYFEEISRWVHVHLRPPSTKWIRIVVEKPFGRDLDNAEKLAASLRTIYADDELFLIDHYLGKRGVHGLRTFISSNTAAYNRIWPTLSSIAITMQEIDTVAGRTSFFDSVGIVRDVMANHLTLIWGLLNPDTASTALRRLDLVQDYTFDHMTLGQYDGYTTDVHYELKKTTTTATAATTRFRHKHGNVSVVVAAGKGLSRREVRVALQFGTTCQLVFVIQGPDGEYIEVCDVLADAVSPPPGWTLHAVERRRLIPESMKAVDAYTFLLEKVIRGDSSHFMHLDDILLGWRLWQPVLDKSDVSDNVITYPLGDVHFLQSVDDSEAIRDEL